MSTEPRLPIGLLIVDLDDTIWTWFDAWHESFSSMLTELRTVTGLRMSRLIPAIKAVHEEKGTAEYSWLLDDLPLLDPWLKHQGKKADEVFDSVLHRQNSARKYNTRLYPAVASTLKYIKAQGVTIVAYTESLAYWTEWRVRLTGLDGVIDVIYSSPDHDFPEGESPETVRTLPPEGYGLKATEHRHVARGISKPDPQILNEIIGKHAVEGKGVVYVGDSVDRDIEMAQRAGVYDVHAKYGEKHYLPEYDLLRAVTHWKKEEVEKERSRNPKVKAKPSFVLDRNFGQILNLFDFGGPFDAASHLALWKESVGVQMHFNDIGWRIRGLALTVLTFTIGAVGFAYVNADAVVILGSSVSPAFAVPLLGAVLWTAFWFADRGWFHKLLIGAVKESRDLEEALSAHGIRANLGAYITEQSPIRFFRRQRRAARLSRAPKVQRRIGGLPLEWHSSQKLNIFYWIGFVLLAVASALILVLGPRAVEAQPDPPAVAENAASFGQGLA